MAAVLRGLAGVGFDLAAAACFGAGHNPSEEGARSIARSIPKRSWPGLSIFSKPLGTFGAIGEAWANYGKILRLITCEKHYTFNSW